MTSPWNSVLNTNYVPTDDEATRIRAFCEKPQQKVCEIDREIQQLRKKLDDLLHEREILFGILESHRALVSPIRRVSPELLQQIFLCCLPADRNPVVHPSEAPLLLGRICRLWREVANGTPQLWSAIHIVIPSNDNSSLTSKRYEALLTWLGRSGVTPLHISLHAHLPTEDTLPFVDHIAGLSTRWASVTLALPEAVMLRLCSSINGSVPNLNTVEFDCLDTVPSSPIWGQQLETADCTYVISQFVLMNPSIRHYSLRQQSTSSWGHAVGASDAFTQLFLSSESLQSSKLKTLALTLPFTIMFTGLRPILDLLSALPNLKRCSLKCYAEGGISETLLRPKPVALHALEGLSLCITMRNGSIDEHDHLLPDLFANLLLPRLTDMRLSGITATPTQALASFAQLLIRSSASLKKLSLGLQERSDGLEALVTALEACPQLQELTVLEERDPSLNPWTSSRDHSKLGLGDQVLKALSTPSVSMTLFCPKLDKLSLILLTRSMSTESYLKSFLTVRRLSPLQCTSLASFCIRTIDGSTQWPMPTSVAHFTDEVKSIVDELKRDGMTIDISNPIVKWVTPSSPYLGLETPDDDIVHW